MALPYSTRFLVEKGDGAGSTFLVPAGFVAVARCLDAYCHATGEVDLFFHNAHGGAIWWFHWSPTDQKPAQWQGRQTFFTGETIGVEIDQGGLDGVDYALSGYLLTA